MKTNWQTKTLGDILDILTNGVNCKQDKSGKGERITRIETIAKAEIDFDRVGYCKLNKSEKTKYKLQKGDILFSHINSVIHVGKTAIFNSDEDLYHGINLLLMRPKNFIQSDYLQYFLKSLFLGEYWNTVCKQSINQASVNQQDIKKIQISYPESLSEQKRIVKVLDNVFEHSAKAKKIAENNLQNSKEVFDSYLQSIFEKQGKKWEKKRLADVCERITDGTHQTPNYFNEGIIFLSSRNVTGGKINWDKIKYIDKKQHLEMHKRVAPRLNDILLAKNGTTGVAALVDRNVVFDIYVSLALLRVREMIIPTFLLYFINSKVAKRQFNKRLKGSGVPNLHLEEIREVVVSFPKSIDEQKSIVKKLDELSEQTKKLEEIYKKKVENIEELKKSILQKAFSGEL